MPRTCIKNKHKIILKIFTFKITFNNYCMPFLEIKKEPKGDSVRNSELLMAVLHDSNWQIGFLFQDTSPQPLQVLESL